MAPKAHGQWVKPGSWALFNSQFLKTLISSWLCSAYFCLCSVINMYLPSHILIQQHDKYLSFDIVSVDINWSIYYIHMWRRNMPYTSFLRKKALSSSQVRVKDFGWHYFSRVPNPRCSCHLTESFSLEGLSSWSPKAPKISRLHPGKRIC